MDLLSDHSAQTMLKVCQRIYVLIHGALVTSGDSQSIQDDPRVQQAYLGYPPTQIKQFQSLKEINVPL